MSMLTLKKQELRRRVDSLPNEVAAWKILTTAAVDQNAHFSQLRAIEVLVETLTGPQNTALEALNPDGDPATFERAVFALTSKIVQAQKIWDFFREKLELRHSPTFKTPLWVADTIAWECHRTTLDRAVAFNILPKSQLREPPLVYCTAEYSPATWVRASRPNDGRDYDLGDANLPIPVIEMPWDHVGSAWEYLALHHEVGHDLEADLGLRPVLEASLQQALQAAGTFPPRIGVWRKWQGEVFADLCALRLAGPAFTDALVQLLLLPPDDVRVYNGTDPHPTPYMRILMNAAYIRTLGSSQAIQDHAAAIETEWRAIYGATSATPALDAYAQDFPVVFTALMNTPFPALKNHTVQEVLPDFGDTQDAAIRSAVPFFQIGRNQPNALPLRHAPSAARLAVAAHSLAGTLTADQSGKVHDRVLEYVQQHAPSGVRGGGATEHEKFIASYATRMFS